MNSVTSFFDIDFGGYILKKYLQRTLNYNFTNVRMTSRGWNFRCNICGDSHTRKRSRQGWLLQKDNGYIYYCHVCNTSKSASSWLKEYFNSEYKDYMLELMQQNRKETIRNIVPVEEVLSLPKMKKQEYVDLSDIGFIPIESYSTGIFKDAIDLCKSRKIPYDTWKHWGISLGGTNRKYSERLIIPFYKGENVFFFQARDLIGSDIKYTNSEISKTENIILYNKYDVDYTKPIIITEGPIDSLFLENAMASLSTNIDLKTQEYLNKFDCYYLFDNDVAGRKKSLEYIKSGKNVFLWKKFSNDFRLPRRDKWDMNDVILYLNKNKFTFEELKQYFSNNFFNSMFI